MSVTLICGEVCKSLTPLPEESVHALACRAGLWMDAPCGGRHRCGKCLVRVEGPCPPPAQEEARLLPGDGRRLACFLPACEGMTVYICHAAPVGETGEYRLQPSPSARADALGLAIDLGTTTLSLALCRLQTGEVLQTVSAPNPQGALGADVVSRMAAAARPDGARALMQAVRDALCTLSLRLLKEAGGKQKEVERIALAGNTVMCHLLCGLSTRGMATAPFTPQSLFGEEICARDIGLPFDAAVYITPCFSAFVGGDISAALTAVGCDAGTLLFDIGTNGELALCTPQGVLCASAAAGPAFEGAGLSCGMGGQAGAVCAVRLQERLLVETVGQEPVRGICGAGAISLLALLLREGVLTPEGELLPATAAPLWARPHLSSRGFALSDRVFVTRQDVRCLQLAKAALRAGLECLLARAGGERAVRRLCVAGGFGSRLDAEAAAAVGLFPMGLCDRLQSVGNAALQGALLALADGGRERSLRLPPAQTMELAGSGEFAKAFVKHMNF